MVEIEIPLLLLATVTIGSLIGQDMISFMITTGSLNSQDMIRILKQSRHGFSGKHLCDALICGGQNSTERHMVL